MPVRIVVDSEARLPLDSQLAKTANEFSTLVAVGPSADCEKIKALTDAGCEILKLQSKDSSQRLTDLLIELAKREMTNILVEGGGEILGSLNDLGQIDEFHTFIAPKIIGGANSISPIAGQGQNLMDQAGKLKIQSVQQVGDNIYIIARTVAQPES